MRTSFLYIFIAFTFFACTGIHRHDASLASSTEPLDTVKLIPAKITANPILFENAFVKGTTRKVDTSTINFYGVTIGKIKIVSGRIIACDPLHVDEYGLSYTQVFPVGEFPVQLSIASVGDEELIVFARINFSDEPVERWQLALLKGEKPLPVGDEEFHGYSVDAGVGIFMDEEGLKGLDQSKLYGNDSELFKEMEKHYHNTWKYAMYNFGAHNLAAFSTGGGDGRYATYIGFDATGKPCRLVTDFGIFDWRKK